MVGLNVQPEGSQHKDDGTAIGDAWLKPWTLPWTELLSVTNAGYAVWEIKGLREVTPARIRGVNRRSLTGSYEMMIHMVNAKGQEEKQSVFLAQRKGLWTVTGFARAREGQPVNMCEKRKLGSLACRYTVNGLVPWQEGVQIVPAPPAPVQAAPVEAAPVQADPLQAAPLQTAPVQADPVQAAPVEAAPPPAPADQPAPSPAP